MYRHARQFPHLAGKSDEEIRELVRTAMASNPRLVRVMRARNAAVLCGMLLCWLLLTQMTALGTGTSLVIAGGVATMFLLCWNLVWINTVVFPITRPQSESDHAPG